MGLFSKDVGIDLGTANTLIYVRGEGIVLREPSVVAKNTETNVFGEAGSAAKDMIGRTPGSIVAIRPLKDGVIADYEVTQFMLTKFIRKAVGRMPFGKLRIVICVPSGVTTVERRAVNNSARKAGAKEAYLVEEPIAAAMGAGLPISEPTGSMVVDIGGGTSEVAVISLGGIVVANSVRVAGDRFDESICSYIKKEFNLLIGDATAERIKIGIGCAMPGLKEERMDIRGRDLITGLPKTVTVSSTDIAKALEEPVSIIVEAIKVALEKTPPELSSDIIEAGITLTGGGALLKGIDKLITNETEIKVNIADDPLDCVAKGTGLVIDSIDVLGDILNAGMM